MALWGISTTTETAANNYAIPKYTHQTDRNHSPWNTFADRRGWIQRHYKTTEQSGLSTHYYDEILVPVSGLNTTGVPSDLSSTGLSNATPVAVFFEDPNLASPISIGAGGTSGIGTGKTGYVHVVWNEQVYCTAGATVTLKRYSATGTYKGTTVATAASVAPNCNLPVYTNEDGFSLVNNFNGQISNRISFAFTVPNTGIGTFFTIDTTAGVVGTVTDFYSGDTVVTDLSDDLIHNVGGAGSYLSVTHDTNEPIGIGTTTLKITA